MLFKYFWTELVFKEIHFRENFGVNVLKENIQVLSTI